MDATGTMARTRMWARITGTLTAALLVAALGATSGALARDRDVVEAREAPTAHVEAQIEAQLAREPVSLLADQAGYVEIWVFDCGGTGHCTGQGWADLTVTDGDVTYFGISQANGSIAPLGPFHAEGISILQGYHVIEEEPLVQCGERTVDLATGQVQDLDTVTWVELELDAGAFTYHGFDAPLLTCYIVTNAI